MSRKLLVVALASAVLTWNAAAQTSAGSETSTAASSQTSVSASGSGAQANSTTFTNASQNGNVSRSASANSAASSSASANAGSGTANLASGTTMNAVLTKSLDSRHAKPGDELAAKLTQDVKSNGKVVLPKNSKLVGHVTEAKAKEKGDAGAQSSLGVVFDHALLKSGEQVPMHVVIQALAASQSNAAASVPFDEPMGAPMGGGVRGSGGAQGGMGSTVGATAGAAGGAVGNVGRTAGGVVNTSAGTAGAAAGNAGGALSATGQLTSQSTGVIGLSGVQLASQASSATQGSLITSSSKSVRLDSGTQILLRVANQ